MSLVLDELEGSDVEGEAVEKPEEKKYEKVKETVVNVWDVLEKEEEEEEKEEVEKEVKNKQATDGKPHSTGNGNAEDADSVKDESSSSDDAGPARQLHIKVNKL